MPERRALREAALVGVTLLWAETFLVLKSALPYCNPFVLVTLRFVLATGVSLLLWARELRCLRELHVLRFGLVLGISYGAGFFLQTWGLAHTTVARNALLTGTFVVFVPLLQRLIWKRNPTALEWWGAAVGMLGIALMSNADLGGLNRGDVATLAGAVVWSYYMGYLSYGAAYQQAMSTGALVVVQCGVTALMGMLMLVANGGTSLGSVQWRWEVIVALLYTSLFATVVTTYVQTHLQPGLSAARVALIFALEPAFATMLAVAIRGEMLMIHEAIGALLIVGAAMLPALPRMRRV